MIFEKAKSRDIPDILSMYSSAVGRQFCTWNESYPGESELNNDFNSGNLFVLRDGLKVAGAVSIACPNELDDFSCWECSDNCGEFARLVLHRDYCGRHLSGMLVDGVLEELEKRGIFSAHISVAKVNIPAKKLYLSKGFSIRGEAFMYGIDFFLCEKSLLH